MLNILLHVIILLRKLYNKCKIIFWLVSSSPSSVIEVFLFRFRLRSAGEGPCWWCCSCWCCPPNHSYRWLSWWRLKLESGPISSLQDQEARSPEAIPLLPPGRRVGSWAHVVCPRPEVSDLNRNMLVVLITNCYNHPRSLVSRKEKWIFSPLLWSPFDMSFMKMIMWVHVV